MANVTEQYVLLKLSVLLREEERGPWERGWKTIQTLQTQTNTYWCNLVPRVSLLPRDPIAENEVAAAPPFARHLLYQTMSQTYLQPSAFIFLCFCF